MRSNPRHNTPQNKLESSSCTSYVRITARPITVLQMVRPLFIRFILKHQFLSKSARNEQKKILPKQLNPVFLSSPSLDKLWSLSQTYDKAKDMQTWFETPA